MDELNPNNLENFDKIETVDLQVDSLLAIVIFSYFIHLNIQESNVFSVALNKRATRFNFFAH